MDKVESIAVSIAIGDIKVQFNGAPESVMSSVLNFLAKEIPSLNLAHKITLNFSSQELIESYGHLIKLTAEGPRVIPDPGTKLSDKDIVALQLVAARIAKELGKGSDDALQVSEIQSATALNPKSISSRISEMTKAGLVSRSDAEPGKYKITTAGIQWLGQTVAKKTRAASQQ
jgi:predicted transcriptional regulator